MILKRIEDGMEFYMESCLWKLWYHKVMSERILMKEDKRFMYDVDETQELGEISSGHYDSMRDWIEYQNKYPQKHIKIGQTDNK